MKFVILHNQCESFFGLLTKQIMKPNCQLTGWQAAFLFSFQLKSLLMHHVICEKHPVVTSVLAPGQGVHKQTGAMSEDLHLTAALTAPTLQHSGHLILAGFTRQVSDSDLLPNSHFFFFFLTVLCFSGTGSLLHNVASIQPRPFLNQTWITDTEKSWSTQAWFRPALSFDKY